MPLQTNEVSELTDIIVSLFTSKNSKKNYGVEQAINSLDEQSADVVISNCLENLLKLDHSLQQLFINTVFNQNNITAKKVLTKVLLRQLNHSTSG